MPKIIENIREKLLTEAKRQVIENGYSAMTIRSVATACGVGTGTVYNYFPSKDMLVANFMLEDWMECIQEINKGMTEAKDAKAALLYMYEELITYKEKYTNLFSDENAEASYTASSMQRHHLLREQLAEPIKTWTRKQTKTEPDFLAEFIAENMLTWTMSGKEFENIAEILLQLL
ncbi:MAG: TetR/AcrR family transcriptional regulator [Agathobacter sp.]|nr:TetR/AcrR family transcriptional regulator [Agathobacter sp.]